jgi:hypothetical protein
MDKLAVRRRVEDVRLNEAIHTYSDTMRKQNPKRTKQTRTNPP